MAYAEGLDGKHNGNGYPSAVEKLILQPESKSGSSFLNTKRPDLRTVLTPNNPWVDFTMEVYLQDYGLLGGGGLGILKGDTALEAARLGLPFAIFSLFYPSRMIQRLDPSFYQQDYLSETVSPSSLAYQRLRDYQWLLDTKIRANEDEVRIGLYKVPNLPIYLLYEPGLQYQYPGENNIDHRLFQDAVLGFGGFKARRALGINSGITQIDEAPTALVPLAEVDYFCQKGIYLDEAKQLVRSRTLFTNHTLINAAEASFTSDQLERYVINNLETNQVKEWLRALARDNGQRLSLSTLALELSGVRNGVSRIHAQFASQIFRDPDGSFLEFKPVTNGISLERWVQPELLKLYQDMGIFDEYYLPTEKYQEGIDALDPVVLREMKDQARVGLRDCLATRFDQYNNPVVIPTDAKIACWTKRIAGYKRPEMLFDDPQRLAEILETKNVHIILSGKAHPTDRLMKEQLQWILKTIDANPILKQRVHFVQNYDEDLADDLVAGVDIGFNTPKTKDDAGNRINTEADGTFWKKLMINLAILVSTRDGGVADVDKLPCIEVVGDSYQEEVASLYTGFEKAAEEVDDLVRWEKRVKDQLKAYLPTISGPRMLEDYLNLMFPKEQTEKSTIKLAGTTT